MSKLAITLSTPQAEYIRETLAPVAKVEFWDGAQAGEQRIALGDAARAHLESLPEDSDGYLDSEGRIWIGGTDYQAEAIRNA
jgi:hypothetical protein